MAKHMRVEAEPADLTEVAPATKVRRRDTTSLPYGEAASYHYSYPTAVPTDDYLYEQEVPARGGIAMLGRAVLLINAWALRLCAFMLVFLLVANVLALPLGRAYLLRLTDVLTEWLPWARFGTPVLDTPFAGVFRIDFAVMALVFFICDWALCRTRLRLL